MPRPRSLKKWLWLGILLLAAVVLLLLTRRGLRPFRDLEAADLIAVSVELLPPDVTVTLDAAEHVPAPQPEEGTLLAALDLLPPKYRTVIYLYYYEGYSAREIAALLGEKPATIFTRLDRGRQKLRTYLEQEELT